MIRRSSFATLAMMMLGACSPSRPPATSDGGRGARCETDADCDDGLYCNGIERCAGDASGADARGCALAGTRPCSVGNACSEIDDRCVADCADEDGDGVASSLCGGDDCADDDPDRYPGNSEVCDARAHDEDCNPETFGARDADDDGEIDARCCNGDRCGTDCDDSMAGTRHAVPEVCNHRDDDCDGSVDEGNVAVALYPDLDRDGDGDRTAAPTLVCAGSAGFSNIATDCEDTPGPVARLRSGRTIDVVDGIDNDCDDLVDEASPPAILFEDRDGDGYGTRRVTMASTRVLAGFALLEGDCDDGDRWVSPGVPVELCNAIDDDCDGSAGYVIGLNDFEDDDGDGSADAACEGGSDCDDRRSAARPGGVEVCDRMDDDCDGAVDEACGVAPDAGPLDAGSSPGDAGADASRSDDGGAADTGSPDDTGPPPVDAGPVDAWCEPIPIFRDADADGFGDASVFVVGCALTGYVANPDDCDDADAMASPLANDAPGRVGIDDDCDGTIDG